MIETCEKERKKEKKENSQREIVSKLTVCVWDLSVISINISVGVLALASMADPKSHYNHITINTRLPAIVSNLKILKYFIFWSNFYFKIVPYYQKVWSKLCK
jgi:hypothetical protein